ncbi:nicotinamide riboside transporter PnuC [Desulfobacterales bacterium HSG16]|nr:nicotinamide riboside transporter PnuC [Desulfobacterales bacterium HSG16]
MDPVEICATIFGLACVWLTIKQNIWCWPTGIVMVSLYIYIFFNARLYSDMGLQVIYEFMQIYGWYNWLYGGKDKTVLSICRMKFPGAVFWAITGIVAILATGFCMDRFTNADFAYPDAATTVMSLIAQWLMAKKILGSWLIWIAVDVLSIGIYSVKGLYLTAGLYSVFLCLAIMGYLGWKKEYQKFLSEKAKTT